MENFGKWFAENVVGITQFNYCGINGNLGWVGLVLLILLENKKIRWVLHHTGQFLRNISHIHEAERSKEAM
jgi:hypothetical protein